jgi:hypothetical protein
MSNPTPAKSPATATPAAPDVAAIIRPLHHMGRDIRNNVATALHYIEQELPSAYADRVAFAERALPTCLAAILRDADAIAETVPALRRLIPAPAEIDDRERALTRLGLTVRVRYFGPTNTKGGRYVAEICDDDDRARVSVCSQSRNRDESTRLEAAEKCLTKWHAARVVWWRANVGKEWGSVPPVFHAKGWNGSEWLFFATPGA